MIVDGEDDAVTIVLTIDEARMLMDELFTGGEVADALRAMMGEAIRRVGGDRKGESE